MVQTVWNSPHLSSAQFMFRLIPTRIITVHKKPSPWRSNASAIVNAPISLPSPSPESYSRIVLCQPLTC
ncbi:hypothetical protein BDD12DRAFT_821016 [Trichophaea hybrida]|nr:hypothetical protein BDD12DRAFT_821016 [Trichophaea hybrida]